MAKEVAELVAQATTWLLSRIQQEKPWQGISGLPVRIADGKPYEGTNIPLLWMQQEQLGSTSNVWGTFQSFLRAGERVRAGQVEGMAIRFVPSALGAVTDQSDDPYMRIAGDTEAVCLFNLAQTSRYKPSCMPVAFEAGSLIDVDQHVTATIMQHEADGVVLSVGEVSFVARFARDVASMLHGVAPGEILDVYPVDAVQAIAARGADLKKLCGVASSAIRRWSKARAPSNRCAISGPVNVDRRAAEDAFDAILGIVTCNGAVALRT